MNDDQVNSLIRGVLKIISGALAAHGAAAAAAQINSQDVTTLVVSIVLAFIAFYGSHRNNATPTTPVKTV